MAGDIAAAIARAGQLNPANRAETLAIRNLLGIFASKREPVRWNACIATTGPRA